MNSRGEMTMRFVGLSLASALLITDGLLLNNPMECILGMLVVAVAIQRLEKLLNTQDAAPPEA